MDTAHDVLVIGAGCAGMRAAIAAYDAGADVAVISKLHPTRSHSGAAEGGINAALGNAGPDSPETHAFDTVKGSDFLADQDAVEVFAREAPNDIYELDHWGAVFTRADDGRLAQRPFGAAGSPRTVFAADITGHVLIQVLYEQLVKRDIRVYEEFFAWKLIEDGGRCQGVIAWDLLHGGLEISGRSTILATGGIGRIYRITTNAYASTGDGAAMALRLGLPLKDMEFMQFHPTTLYPTGILMTEGCRGEGAFLINKDGERFMKRYAPNALELASRDVVSRSEQTEIDEGRGVNGSVMLDMRHLGAAKIIERLPGSRELAITYAGVDPIYDPVPVRPGAHYHMGGVATDAEGPPSSRAVCGGRGRMRLRARGQPSRRQLADGDDHLRPAGRARGGRRGAPRRRRRGAGVGSRRRAVRARHAARAHNGAASGRGRSARSSARRCSRTSASSAARTRCRSRSGSSTASSSATRRSSSRTRATSSTPTSPRRSSSAAASSSPRACSSAGSSGRRAAARTPGPTTTPSRDDENYLKHSLSAGSTADPSTAGPGDDHQVATRREDVLMQVAEDLALDPASGERELREYEVDAPEESTLLDVLELVKDRLDGTLAYRRSCRMMICGSCAMRIDGVTVLACKLAMRDVRRGGEGAGDLADGQPPDRQGPRRRHGALLGKFRAVDPYLSPATTCRPRGGARDLAAADGRDPQGVALHQLRRLRLGVQRVGVEP